MSFFLFVILMMILGRVFFRPRRPWGRPWGRHWMGPGPFMRPYRRGWRRRYWW